VFKSLQKRLLSPHTFLAGHHGAGHLTELQMIPIQLVAAHEAVAAARPTYAPRLEVEDEMGFFLPGSRGDLCFAKIGQRRSTAKSAEGVRVLFMCASFPVAS
jgi:hypothetical protein